MKQGLTAPSYDPTPGYFLWELCTGWRFAICGKLRTVAQAILKYPVMGFPTPWPDLPAPGLKEFLEIPVHYGRISLIGNSDLFALPRLALGGLAGIDNRLSFLRIFFVRAPMALHMG